MHHDLKIKKEHHIDVIEERKLAELRYNDRNYQVGDTVSFKEIGIFGFTMKYPQKYLITHVLPCSSVMPNAENWVVLSLKKI